MLLNKSCELVSFVVCLFTIFFHYHSFTCHARLLIIGFDIRVVFWQSKLFVYFGFSKRSHWTRAKLNFASIFLTKLILISLDDFWEVSALAKVRISNKFPDLGKSFFFQQFQSAIETEVPFIHLIPSHQF